MWLRQVVGALILLLPLQGSLAAEADCLFVEAARLGGSWPPYSASAIAPLDLSAIHRISGGKNIVALLRSYTGKKGDETDAEEFWKMTIELPVIAPGGSYVLPATASNTRFSRAGSAWVEKGFGYVGAGVTGTISAHRLDEYTLTIDISVEIETRFAGDPAETQLLEIRKNATLRRLEIADLTPWLGSAVAGAGDYWTTHRPKELRTSCDGGT